MYHLYPKASRYLSAKSVMGCQVATRALQISIRQQLIGSPKLAKEQILASQNARRIQLHSILPLVPYKACTVVLYMSREFRSC